MDRLKTIAEALHVSISYLLGWEDEAPENDTNELDEYLEMLRTRPECRLLLKTIKGATKAEVEANVKFLEAMRGKTD